MSIFFSFNDTATTEIYTLSLHDALPICQSLEATRQCSARVRSPDRRHAPSRRPAQTNGHRSEEHTSELQSRFDLVCRLLLEKKKHNLTEAHRCRTGTNSAHAWYVQK